MTPMAQTTNAHAAQSRYPPKQAIAQSRHWRTTHLIDLSLWQRLYPYTMSQGLLQCRSERHEVLLLASVDDVPSSCSKT